MQIPKLVRFDWSRTFCHQIRCFRRFRKSDDVADGGGAAEDGDEAVEAEGDAAVGWGAVAEGFEHIAKQFSPKKLPKEVLTTVGEYCSLGTWHRTTVLCRRRVQRA